MKKFLSLLFFLSITTFAYSQVNMITIERDKSQSDPNEQFLNGISTRTDIGGVDIRVNTVNFTHIETGFNPNTHESIETTTRISLPNCIIFTNYNPFPVTVSYQYNYTELYEGQWVRHGIDRERYKTVNSKVVIPAASGNKYPEKIISLDRPGYPYTYEIFNLISITHKVGN